MRGNKYIPIVVCCPYLNQPCTFRDPALLRLRLNYIQTRILPAVRDDPQHFQRAALPSNRLLGEIRQNRLLFLFRQLSWLVYRAFRFVVIIVSIQKEIGYCKPLTRRIKIQVVDDLAVAQRIDKDVTTPKLDRIIICCRTS